MQQSVSVFFVIDRAFGQNEHVTLFADLATQLHGFGAWYLFQFCAGHFEI